MKPDDGESIQEHSPRSRSLNGLGKTIGRIFQAQVLFGVVVRDFDGPSQFIDGGDDVSRDIDQAGQKNDFLRSGPVRCALAPDCGRKSQFVARRGSADSIATGSAEQFHRW